MALTYEQSAALMVDPTFTDRVKVACMKYANYILDEPANTPAHQTRIKWAQQTIYAPAVAAGVVMPTLVMDGQVQADGSNITDAALQTSVEVSLNKLL